MAKAGKEVTTRQATRKGDDKKIGEKLFGAYLEELGICSAEQVQQALGYSADCSKWGRFIPIGQALVELGYTTMNDIDEVLHLQARDRAAARSKEIAATDESAKTQN